MTVALLPGSNELHLDFRPLISKFDLRRTEILKNREMRLTAQHPFQLLSDSNATTHHHDVDIVGRALEKDITHIATNHVAFHPETVRRLADLMKQRLV